MWLLVCRKPRCGGRHGENGRLRVAGKEGEVKVRQIGRIKDGVRRSRERGERKGRCRLVDS